MPFRLTFTRGEREFATEAFPTKRGPRVICYVDGKRVSGKVFREAQEAKMPKAKNKRSSLKDRQERVKAAWDRIEDNEPDISTERLLAMVADDTGEDYGDIAALYQGENPDA